MKMFRTLLLFSIVLLSLSNVLLAKNGFLVHITSNDPHRVSMALTFAEKMSHDYDVFVYVDIDGVVAMLKDKESIRFKNFEASRTLIDKLVKSGVQISVCKMCLEAHGHTQYDLIAGLKIAEGKDFFGFTSGRIITIDY
ncbi:MAG: peroxiredoxin [Ignavibacteriales bacterium]|nr:MAG: peroxiredoxin [Ignavibacteriales bacterium]